MSETYVPYPPVHITQFTQKQLRLMMKDARKRLEPPKTDTQRYYEKYIMIFGKKIVYKKGRESVDTLSV